MAPGPPPPRAARALEAGMGSLRELGPMRELGRFYETLLAREEAPSQAPGAGARILLPQAVEALTAPAAAHAAAPAAPAAAETPGEI